MGTNKAKILFVPHDLGERLMTHRTFLRGAAVIALVASSYLAPQSAGAVQVTAFQQAVAENVSTDDQIAAFYRNRGFDPIWTGDTDADLERRTALLEVLSMAKYHGLPVAKYNAEALLSRLSLIHI